MEIKNTLRTANEIYGGVKHLDLRGCSLDFDELKYFSLACNRLSSIAITHAATYLPIEHFLNKKSKK